MIVNPSLVRLETVPASNLLVHDFGLVGKTFELDKNRWEILGFYSPNPRRYIRGIRARIFSADAGVLSFINQRDLEVCLGIGIPDTMCPWLGKPYAAVRGPDWYGTYVDDDDNYDDLYEWECHIRKDYPVIPEGMSLERPIRFYGTVDQVELNTLLTDYDPNTGEYPDMKLATIKSRWARVERRPIWKR